MGKYSWQWEPKNGPSVIIHETGHALGLPDYYDYDTTVGPGGGVGGFDMMDRRGDHNCFSKWILEWLTPTVVAGTGTDLTLRSATEYKDAVLIWPEISLDDQFSEFFMVENRQNLGNDTSLWFEPDGLAIWHVDATLTGSGFTYLYDNSYTDHKLLRLMEADGLEQIETYLFGTSVDENDLFRGGDTFDNGSVPSSTAYDGTDSCVTVSDIVDLGSSPGDAISATFDFSSCISISGYVRDPIGTAMAGVLLVPSGLNETATTDGDGYYSISIPVRWSGSVTPSMEGHIFTPRERTYDVLSDSVIDQDYTGAALDSILDRFLSYKVKTTRQTPKFSPVNLTLQDMFEWKGFEAKKVKSLLHPTEVDGVPILNSMSHLVGYQIKKDKREDKHEKQLNLKISNLLGTIILDTRKSDSLLVPSAKDLDLPVEPLPEPEDIDHFKCYSVKVKKGVCNMEPTIRCKNDDDCPDGTCNMGFPKGLQVDAADQFGKDKRFDIKKPTKLCTPVDKDGEGIIQPDAHLMCYKINKAKDQPRHEKVGGIYINNPFGPDQLGLGEHWQVDTVSEEELCIPSAMVQP